MPTRGKNNINLGKHELCLKQTIYDKSPLPSVVCENMFRVKCYLNSRHSSVIYHGLILSNVYIISKSDKT